MGQKCTHERGTGDPSVLVMQIRYLFVLKRWRQCLRRRRRRRRCRQNVCIRLQM